MKLNNEKLDILLSINNHTGQSQQIDLFDNSNVNDGGLFEGKKVGRTVNYDISTQTFPNPVQTTVSVNYNSVILPISHSIVFDAGKLTYNSLLEWLNSLGIGTFTDGGSSNIRCVVNYQLVSDNGGMVGVELSINNIIVIGTFIAEWNVSSNGGGFTGSISYNDTANSGYDIVENVIPGSTGTQSGNQEVGISKKQVIISGNTTLLTDVTLHYSGGNYIQEDNNGPVNLTFTPVSEADGDTLSVTIANSNGSFDANALAAQNLVSGSSSFVNFIDEENPSYPLFNKDFLIQSGQQYNSTLDLNQGKKDVSFSMAFSVNTNWEVQLWTYGVQRATQTGSGTSGTGSFTNVGQYVSLQSGCNVTVYVNASPV